MRYDFENTDAEFCSPCGHIITGHAHYEYSTESGMVYMIKVEVGGLTLSEHHIQDMMGPKSFNAHLDKLADLYQEKHEHGELML
jgi:hypothetical protein